MMKRSVVISVLSLLLLSSVGYLSANEVTMNDVIQRVRESTSKQIRILRNVYDKVPEEARPAVKHAILMSKHGRKTAVEAVKLANTKSPLRRAKKRLQFAQKRISELKKMARTAPPGFTQTLINNYKQQINSTLSDIRLARSQGMSTRNLLKRVNQATSRHQRVLGNVYEHVPEQAKPAIQRAREVSKRGQQQATKAINRRPGSGERDSYRGPENTPNRGRSNPDRGNAQGRDRRDGGGPPGNIPSGP